jgi:hypothetical protein
MPPSSRRGAAYALPLLQAIKRYVTNNLSEHRLTVGAVATTIA